MNTTATVCFMIFIIVTGAIFSLGFMISNNQTCVADSATKDEIIINLKSQIMDYEKKLTIFIHEIEKRNALIDTLTKQIDTLSQKLDAALKHAQEQTQRIADLEASNQSLLKEKESRIATPDQNQGMIDDLKTERNRLSGEVKELRQQLAKSAEKSSIKTSNSDLMGFPGSPYGLVFVLSLTLLNAFVLILLPLKHKKSSSNHEWVKIPAEQAREYGRWLQKNQSK